MCPAKTACQLGPYALQEEIGRGGMGVVWRGSHIAHNTTVAIKVLLGGARASEPAFVAAFKQEARAVGRLNHPHIVSVLDYGILPPGVEVATNKALVAGQPYLVMEWLSGATLDTGGMRPTNFDALAPLLFALLDALAHAHARGVLHRDIKSSNIVAGPGASVRLIDFGIARLDAPDARDEALQGTVSSMAPEQIDPAQRRDQGPCTDLYGIGCLAFELSAGRLPFERATVLEYLAAHLNDPVPPLRPVMAVPPRFEAWVQRMLAKDPRARFRCAADAAQALLEVQAEFADHLRMTGDTPHRPPHHTHTSAGAMSTLGTLFEMAHAPTLGPTDVRDAGGAQSTTPTGTRVMADGISPTPARPAPEGLARPAIATPASATPANATPAIAAPPVATPATAWPRPPVPTTWRRPAVADEDTPRPGAGIFRMRTIPMVDRGPERDAIWSALRRAVNKQHVEVVVLRGAAGCGKSRVAQWTLERAVELGCVNAMTAWHGPTESELGGPTGMLARYLKCTGLRWHELQARVRHVLEPLGATPTEIQAAAEILRGVARGDVAMQRGSFTSESERIAVLTEVLKRLAEERPLFVWLDDVQWGPEALRLTQHLLQTCHHALIVVLTIRDEALIDAPIEAATVAELESHARVATVPVRPLQQSDSVQLVQAMLGLDPSVAKRIVKRSAGNPLFAVQLVGDLVDRGLVRPDASGHYVLSESAVNEPFALADDIHEVWQRRTEQLLRRLRGARCARHGEQPCACAQDALEIAAVLGQDVATEIWRNACGEADVAWSGALLEVLLEDKLVIEEEEGFRFEHGLLRESLEQRARDRGVLARHHAACARTLATMPRPDPERLARIAEHACGASDFQSAASSLHAAAHEALRRGQLARVSRYVARLAELVEQHETLRGDEGQAELLFLRAISIREDHPEQALSMLEDARKRARSGGHEVLLARALSAIYRHHHRRVGATRVSALIEEAVELFEKHKAYSDAVSCLHTASRDALERSAHDEARSMLLDMRRLADLSDDPLCLAECLDRECDLLRAAGDTTQALQANRKAVQMYETLGCLVSAATMLIGLAEIHWFNLKDLTAASETLHECIARHAAIGSRRHSYFPRYNLASVEIHRGRLQEARPIIAWLDANTEALGYPVARHMVHLMQGVLAADEGRWAAWDEHVAIALSTGNPDEFLADEDVSLWRCVASIVHAAGEPERADVVWAHAAELAERLSG